MMQPLEIVGQSARDASNPSFTPSRLLNRYAENTPNGRVLRAVPGQVAAGDLPGVLPRAMAEIGGALWVVQGGNLYEVDRDWAATFQGAVDEDEFTGIAGNNGAITVTAGGSLYVLQAGAITEPTTHIGTLGDVVTFGQRTVVVERGGRRIQWSGLLAPTTFDSLDFATTEAGEDFNLRAVPLGGALWMMKQQSIEQWIATENGLEYVVGSKQDVGLRGFEMVAKMPNDLFWVANDATARLASQGIISTTAVEESIASGTPLRCVTYRRKGARFACIIFENRPAWCFDLSTGEWHERAHDDDTWDVRGVAEVYASTVAADSFGRLRTFGGNPTIAGNPIVRQVTTRTLENNGERFRVPKLELVFAQGDANATVQIEVSRDRGRTWGARRDYPLGAPGEYGAKLKMRGLGSFDTMNLRITMSAAAEVPMMATAYVEIVQ